MRRRCTARRASLSIVGRWACDGPDDIDRVRDLQDRIALTPLVTRPEGSTGARSGGPEELAFGRACGSICRRSLRHPGTSHCSRPSRRRLARIGIVTVRESRSGTGEDSRRGRRAGAGADRTGAEVRFGRDRRQRLASGVPHLDYNDDSSKSALSTVGEWRIEDRRKAIGVRAAAAMGGLWVITATRPRTARSTPMRRARSSPGAHLRDHVRVATTGGGVLVDHDVQHAALLSGVEPDRAVLDRRPHAGLGTDATAR